MPQLPIVVPMSPDLLRLRWTSGPGATELVLNRRELLNEIVRAGYDA